MWPTSSPRERAGPGRRQRSLDVSLGMSGKLLFHSGNFQPYLKVQYEKNRAKVEGPRPLLLGILPTCGILGTVWKPLDQISPIPLPSELTQYYVQVRSREPGFKAAATRLPRTRLPGFLSFRTLLPGSFLLWLELLCCVCAQQVAE